MKQQQKPEGQKSENEKPMAEDFVLPQARNMASEIDELKQDILDLRKIFHDRGLEIGMPAQLNFDIGRIASVITSMLKDMPDINSEDYKLEEADIIKCLNNGNRSLAFHKKTMQAERYQRKLNEVKGNLNLLLQVLAMFQSRLVAQNKKEGE